MSVLTKMYNWIKGKIPGWKTQITAIAALIVNGWDAIAPSLDMGQIFSSDHKRAIFNAFLAVLVFVFRQMAKGATNVADKLEPLPPLPPITPPVTPPAP